ncbi:MAG: hypothetical protein KBD31_01215 [Proteobacteria bacterium]|nr:hypothetical protein [Pseudomonadota bacterium]
MTFDKIDEKTKFNIMLRRKQELDTTLKKHSKTEKGTVDFVIHKLNRERKKINEELAKVSFRYMPDTIA